MAASLPEVYVNAVTRLAKSVIADIAKMQARAAISGLFNFAISAAASYFGGGSAGQIGGAGAGPTAFGVQPGSTFGSLGSGFSGVTMNALGGVYDSPSLSAYSGQVVAAPTLFAFTKGAGLMGEAGPEGIFPLKRGPNGALGVQAFGAGGQIQVTTTVNVYSDGRADASTVSQTDMGKAMGDMVNQAVSARFQQELRQNGNLWKIMNGMRAA